MIEEEQIQTLNQVIIECAKDYCKDQGLEEEMEDEGLAFEEWVNNIEQSEISIQIIKKLEQKGFILQKRN